MVSPDSGDEIQTDSISQSISISESPSEDCLRFILENGEASFDDFIKFAFEKREGIQRSNIEFIEEYKRPSTKRQYNASWKRWRSFVLSKVPSIIDKNFCISFFKHLYDNGLSASTITSYKSALARPILYGFDIDWSNDFFSKVPIACARLRP